LFRGRLSTLADVARLTGARPRSVQFWANAGVVRPVEGTTLAGSGIHRLFEAVEVAVAMIVSRFASEQVAIGGLNFIALSVRPKMESDNRMESAIRGKRDLFLALDTHQEALGLLGSSQLFSDEAGLCGFVTERSRLGRKVNVLCLSEILKPIRELLE
jgi:hypothetical protein